MDTSILCVYNLERRVFLSSKVTIVNGLSEPLKVVRLLVSGLGVGAESGLWLTHLQGMLTVPKLFPYDLACLDKDLRIVETIEVLPGVEFPPHRQDVSSAVLLPPDTLRTTQTRVGDRLIVCPTEQAGQLLANLDTIQAPLKKEEPLGTVQKVAKPEELLANARVSSVSITEAIVEKLDIPDVPAAQTGAHWAGLEDLFANWVDSPSAPPSWITQKAREHQDRTRRTQSSEAQKSPITKDQDPQSSKPTPLASEVALAAKSSAPVDRKTESQDISPKEPSSAPIPRPPQNTSFTIAQYGMWQVSSPTAVGPIASVKRPALNGVAGQSTAKKVAGPTQETAQRQNGTIGKKPPEIAATGAASQPAERGQSSSPTEKSADRPVMKKPEPDAPPPPSAKADPQTKIKLPVAASGATFEKSTAVPISESTLQAENAQSPAQEAGRNQIKVKTANSSKATDFDVTVENKLDRLQMNVPPSSAAEVSSPKPAPVFARDTSAEKRESEAKAKPTSLNAPETSAKSVSKQPMAPPPKRFLSSNPAEKEKPKDAPQRVGSEQKTGTQSESISMRFKRWLNPAPAKNSDRRRAQRHYVPGMAAYYFTGGAPKPHDVADISMSGMYVHTDDRWLPETMIRMTLQKPCAKGEKKQSITVLSRIVRRGSDGVAAEFVMEEAVDPNSRDILPSQATDRFSLARFL